METDIPLPRLAISPFAGFGVQYTFWFEEKRVTERYRKGPREGRKVLSWGTRQNGVADLFVWWGRITFGGVR
jgi:hypothetical protein